MRIPALLLLAHTILPAQELIPIPGKSFEVTDAISTVKLRVSVGGFLIGRTEVTQADYQAVAGKNPAFYNSPRKPVENVSWWDAIRYCNLRSQKEKLTPCYDATSGRRTEGCTGYRLPTEAEWIVAAGPPGTGQLGDTSTKSIDLLEGRLAKGTAEVGTHTANQAGLFDMWGNVWEWCEDYFSVRASVDSVRDPRGPGSGLARVLRGGSFVSTTSRWSRDYRSSMHPDSRSRYTGFRVARSVTGTVPVQASAGPDFYRRFQQAPASLESSTGSLSTLTPAGTTAASWPAVAKKLRAQWEALLAAPGPSTAPPSSRLVRAVDQRGLQGEIVELEMEPGSWEKLYVLRPSPHAWKGPRPVLIVPFYDIDTPAAFDLGGRVYAPDRGVNGFAYTAAQHGYIAVAVRWFGESYGEWYGEAVANLAVRHPGATGLGKWVTDGRRTVDFAATLPGADASRIGIMGHSLGGKMALYAGAFDSRIRAVVASEPGIGFPFSNYDDYWYLGAKLASAPSGTDQHQLLALIAPRPFLLIGGDEYDKAESWHYINAARTVYELLGQRDNIGYFNHHTGHTPSPDSISAAFDWLGHFLKP